MEAAAQHSLQILMDMKQLLTSTWSEYPAEQLFNRHNFLSFSFPIAQDGPWIDEMLIQDL